MKKLILLLAAGIIATAAADAQTPDAAGNNKTTAQQHPHRGGGKHKHGHRHGRRGHKPGGRSVAHIRMTDMQRQQARTINEDYRKQVVALRAQDNITMGDYKKQLSSLQAAHKEKLQQLLTADQKQELAQQKTQRQEWAQQRSAAQLDRMKTRLNLSDDQVAKLKQQQTDLHTKIAAIRENQSLDESAKRQQVQALMQQRKDNLKSVLTKEQLDNLHNNLRGNRDVK